MVLSALTWLMVALFAVLPLAHLPALRAVLAAAATLAVAVILLRERRVPPAALPMAAWCLLAVASLLWSADPNGTLHDLLYAMLLPSGVFLAGWRVAREERGFERMHWTVLGSALLLAAIVAIAALTGRLHALQPEGEAAGVLRYWPGVGVASTESCLTAPFALILLASLRTWRKAAGAIVLVGLLAVAAATLNRAVWPALVLTAAAFLAWSWGVVDPPVRRTAALALIAGVVLGGAAFQFATRERLPAAPELESLANDVRFQGWKEWTGIAREGGLLGHGFGRSSVHHAAQGHLSPGLLQREPQMSAHAHNVLLDVAVELGLLGLALYSALLATLLWQYWRLGGSRASRELRLIGAAGCSLVIAMLAKNATDDFMQQAVVLQFWGYAGILLGALEARTSRSKPS